MKYVYLSLILGFFGIACAFYFLPSVYAAACPLTIGQPYKIVGSPAVYYVSVGCKKRPIKNPDVYFSHFTTWREVKVISAAQLNTIPNDELSFLPWGPNHEFKNGSLLKTVDDPRVFLLLHNSLYPIENEEVFLSLGYAWNWVEDVELSVLQKFSLSTTVKIGTLPDGFVFLYPNSPRVYILAHIGSTQIKKYISSVDELNAVYRMDRIGTLATAFIFLDTPLTQATTGGGGGSSGSSTSAPSVSTTPASSTVPMVPSVATSSEIMTPVSSTVPIVPDVPTPTSTVVTSPTTTPIQSDIPSIVSQSALALPPLGQVFTDPAFGTSLRRITDMVPSGGFGTQIYSQLQAFSADNVYILLNEGSAYVVRNLGTLAASTINLGNINTPRWQPAVPHTLVFYDSNEDAILRAQYGNVDSRNVETIFTFPSLYQRIRGNQSFDELSHDGKWMAGMAATSDNDQIIFSLNLAQQSLGAQIRLSELYGNVCSLDPTYGAVEPDWIGVSPTGKYLVVQWKRDGTTRCSGLETFAIATGEYVGRVSAGHQHGDLGIDGTGEFFMTFETENTPNGDPYISIHRLPGSATGFAEAQLLTRLSWTQSGSHISCQSNQPFCSVVMYGDNTVPLGGEIILQYTDGHIRRLVDHRSTSCGYWVQPRASLSRDGSLMAFASDWGVNRCSGSDGRGEAYVLTVPAS